MIELYSYMHAMNISPDVIYNLLSCFLKHAGIHCADMSNVAPELSSSWMINVEDYQALDLIVLAWIGKLKVVTLVTVFLFRYKLFEIMERDSNPLL